MMENYDGLDEIIPPDVSGLGLGKLTAMLPGREELTQAAIAGGGVTAGLLGGLGLERLLRNTFPALPKAAIPAIHVVGGVAIGKIVAGISGPFGVGVASGMVALGIVRALQTWLKLDISLSGLADLDDLADLADLMGEEDLLPPELSQVVIEDSAVDGLLGALVEETAISGW